MKYCIYSELDGHIYFETSYGDRYAALAHVKRLKDNNFNSWVESNSEVNTREYINKLSTYDLWLFNLDVSWIKNNPQIKNYCLNTLPSMPDNMEYVRHVVYKAKNIA